MSRPRTARMKIRPTSVILHAHSVLFKAMYLPGVELPDDVLGMFEALHWVLGAPGNTGFAAALVEVERALRAAETPRAVPVPITNDGQSEKPEEFSLPSA